MLNRRKTALKFAFDEMQAQLGHPATYRLFMLPLTHAAAGRSAVFTLSLQLRRSFAFEEMQAQQQQEQKYNRNHPGVGKAGKGDQATSSAINKSGNARKQQGARDQAGPTRG